MKVLHLDPALRCSLPGLQRKRSLFFCFFVRTYPRHRGCLDLTEVEEPTQSGIKCASLELAYFIMVCALTAHEYVGARSQTDLPPECEVVSECPASCCGYPVAARRTNTVHLCCPSQNNAGVLLEGCALLAPDERWARQVLERGGRDRKTGKRWWGCQTH